MSGSCWHDGPDHCPGCRHCADSWGEEPINDIYATLEEDTPPWSR